MSDFTHTFNHGPSATLKQTLAHRPFSIKHWPIGHFQSILAHWPPSINYGPSAFYFYHSCIAHEKHRNHKSKSHLHHHFGLKNQPLNPILPRDQKGVPGNGADPLLKYLAPPPFYFLYFSYFVLLGYTTIMLCED